MSGEPVFVPEDPDPDEEVPVVLDVGHGPSWARRRATTTMRREAAQHWDERLWHR